MNDSVEALKKSAAVSGALAAISNGTETIKEANEAATKAAEAVGVIRGEFKRMGDIMTTVAQKAIEAIPQPKRGWSWFWDLKPADRPAFVMPEFPNVQYRTSKVDPKVQRPIKPKVVR